MIYSVDFKKICSTINHLELAKYLSDLSWYSVPARSDYINIFQIKQDGEFYQVDVPVDKEIVNYGAAMYEVAKTIAVVQNKSVEQIVLELLNPMADILRVRVANETTKDGSIFFEDALSLYENATKLVSAAALDVTKPAKFHRGRPFDFVQDYIKTCRFGQTEFGSYVTNVVCPFYDKTEDKIVQLSMFDSENDNAHSLTRRITNKIIRSIDLIKTTLDEGHELEEITERDNFENVSVNFLEAVQSLNISREDSLLDISIKWAPTVKMNRATKSSLVLSHNYYEPINALTKRVRAKEEIRADRRAYNGRIKGCDTAEILENRKSGIVKLVAIDDAFKKVTISAVLTPDDYNVAIDAHKRGAEVRLEGTQDPKRKNYIIDCSLTIR